MFNFITSIIGFKIGKAVADEIVLPVVRTVIDDPLIDDLAGIAGGLIGADFLDGEPH